VAASLAHLVGTSTLGPNHLDFCPSGGGLLALGHSQGCRQVAVRFSVPMVTFGDPRLPEPFQIECPAKGWARWADARNWVYDFEQGLPAERNRG
jgi:hypothetical protein